MNKKIIMLLCIVLVGMIPSVSAWDNTYAGQVIWDSGYSRYVSATAMNHDIGITSTMNPYIVNSRGMTYTQTVAFKTMVCNRGRNPEYGIDYSIYDVTAGKYVIYSRDVFNLEAGQCKTLSSVVPITEMTSVWGGKFWSGNAKSYKYIVGAVQNGQDDYLGNNYYTHTMWVKPPIYY